MLKPFVPIQKMKIPVEPSMMAENKKQKRYNLVIDFLFLSMVVLLLYVLTFIITG